MGKSEFILSFYNQEQQTRQALDMLATSKDSPSYPDTSANNYHTIWYFRRYMSGTDEETIVLSHSMIWVHRLSG